MNFMMKMILTLTLKKYKEINNESVLKSNDNSRH